jgi:hypothetical protein
MNDWLNLVGLEVTPFLLCLGWLGLSALQMRGDTVGNYDSIGTMSPVPQGAVDVIIVRTGLTARSLKTPLKVPYETVKGDFGSSLLTSG